MHHLCSCLLLALSEWEGQLFCALIWSAILEGFHGLQRIHKDHQSAALGLAQDTPAIPPCASEHCPNISCSSTQELVLPLLSACFCIFIYDSRPFWNGSFRCLFLSLCQYKLFSRAAIIFHAFVTIFFYFCCEVCGVFSPNFNVTPLALQQSLHMAESSWTISYTPQMKGESLALGWLPNAI